MAVSDVNDSSNSDHSTSVYVGPRPYRLGQELYGRDREAVELSRLLISQRLVLLHSPSGAGKTSLIHAKIIPALQKRRFEIPFHASCEDSKSQPIAIRVNREPHNTDPPGTNRYLLSAMLSLELLRPEHERRGVEELTGMTLDEYLEEAFPAASREVDHSKDEAESFRPLLLIFDQFEELVTMDPTDEKAKREFIRQLGKALQNKGRWALFAIREDYLGALEPYLPALPTNLSATYRLDLLRAEVASTVIEEPARKANVTYEEGVVQGIVEDLRKIRVQGADGSIQYKDGIYVEPVQLQVVCQSLWRIRGSSPVITREHLKKLGQGRGTGVDAVLAGYYANRVAEAASEENVSERLVRNWFSKSLIGSQLVRRPVLVDEALAFGLTPACLQILDKAFLIRREIRSGATWYELAHDRLMAPVLEDNQLWRKKNLTTFQSQAELWEDRSRPDSLLLSGETLQAAESEAERLAGELTTYEQEYLEASQKARSHRLAEQARETELQRVKRLKIVMGLGGLLLILVSSLAGYAVVQRNTALKNEVKWNWLAYTGRIAMSLRDLEEDNPLLARDLLDKTRPDFHGWEFHYLDARIKSIQNVFIGHEGSVNAVACFKDGKRIVSGSVDGTLIIWNMSTRKPWCPPLTSDEYPVTSLALSDDEKWIVSGNDDGVLRIWDLQSDPIKYRELEKHNDSVTCLAIDPDNRWFVAGYDDDALIKWDLETGSQMQVIEAAHEGAVRCVAISPDGQKIVSGGADGTISIWTSDLKSIRKFRVDGAPVTCVDISPDGTWLACGCLDRRVLVWNFNNSRNGNPLLIGRHEDGVSSLAIRPDGQRIATGSRDGVLKEWSSESISAMIAEGSTDNGQDPLKPITRMTLRLKAHAGVVTCLTYGRWTQKSIIISGGTNNMLKMWDGEPPDETPEFTDHTGPVWDVSFEPAGKWIVTASGDRTVRIFPIVEGSIEPRVLRGHTDGVWCADVSPDGKRIVSGGEDQTLRLWDAESGKLIRIMTGHTDAVADVNFSSTPEHQWIVSVGYDGQLIIWDGITGKKRRSWQAHNGNINCCAISADNQYVASGSDDKTVKIWRAQDGKEVQSLKGHDNTVWCTRFSPVENQIVSGSKDGTLRVWDIASGKTLQQLEGHTTWVTSVDYSPDGKRIVSGSGDNSIKLWQLVTGNPTLTLTEHGDTVWAVVFSKDGKSIASCSDDWTFRLWETTVKSNP